MSFNNRTPQSIAISALTNCGKLPVMAAGGESKEELELLHLVSSIVSGVLEGERVDLRQLKACLPALIRNTPHSCHTEEHCCALHAAHGAAAEKVAEVIQKAIDKVGEVKPVMTHLSAVGIGVCGVLDPNIRRTL